MSPSDLISRLKDAFADAWSRFQESNLYIRGKEWYDDLSPTMQKLTGWASLAVVLLVLLIWPWSMSQEATDSLDSFEERKGLIRELFRLKRDLAQAPQVPAAPPSSQLKVDVDQALQSMALTANQIKKVEEIQVQPDRESRLIPPSVNQSGVQVTVWKINLEQFVDLSFKLQKLSNAAKLLRLDMKANAEDNHYYDVIYQLVSFTAPQSTTPAEEPEKENRRKKKSDEEDSE